MSFNAFNPALGGGGGSPPPPSSSSSPPSLLMGQQFALLDPVRDSTFLNVSTKDALNNSIADMGLGIVDNGVFLFTTVQAPTGVTKKDSLGNRLYPIKFFWLGSPKGTTDANDAFAVFVADVNPASFSPGASASTWMANPRLVLSWQQAKNDIVTWFDANYPYITTPPSGGVGQETPTNQMLNGAYGQLTGGNPGNVSGINSIDGQIWPIYDYVDNSIILYFSVKTPNVNTKSIYAYKITDSEISAPVTSSQFLGGVVNWQSSNEAGETNLGIASSHRFSIISPDPMVTTPRTAGQQSAVAFYSYGVFDGQTPDHAQFLTAAVFSDIHTHPLQWYNPTIVAVNGGNGTGAIPDVTGYVVDKLGSIFVAPSGLSASASYAVLFNSTADRDIRPLTNNNVVISSMHIRAAYFHPGTGMIAIGSNPISIGDGVVRVGHCRPQFTTFPDGYPKLIYNAFSSDQTLKTMYEYVDRSKLMPEGHNKLIISHNGFFLSGRFPSFGKKKARLSLIFLGYAYSYQNDPQYTPVLQVRRVEGVWDYSVGGSGTNNVGLTLSQLDVGTLVSGITQSPYDFVGKFNSPPQFDFVVEDLAEYTGWYITAPNIINLQNQTFLGAIILE